MRRHKMFTLVFTIAIVMPTIALAAGAGMPSQIVPNTCHGVDCKCSDLVQLAQNILYSGIYFAVFICAILFAWAGWKMISGKANGESGKIAEAKNILWNVVVGLVIILAAWLIVDALMRTLTNFQIWSDVCGALK